MERDVAPLVMLGRGSNNDDDGIGRDVGSSDGYDDDNGTVVDLQAQEGKKIHLCL